MLTSLLIGLIAAPPVGPIVEPGANEAFHQAVYAVQKDLSGSKFADAGKKARLLPDLNLTMSWDDKAVPAARRAEFVEARDKAIREWTVQLDGLKIQLVKSGAEIAVDFTDQLSPNADSSVPRGAAFTTSFLAPGPSVELTIAMKRGKNLLGTGGRDISNDVAQAIGAHFGLAPLPLVNGMMLRGEEPSSIFRRLSALELGLAKGNLKVVTELKSLVAKKTIIRPSAARLSINPLKVEVPKVVQGEVPAFTMTVTNQGNVPLYYAMLPDCGCFVMPATMPIAPGDTVSQTIRIDTQEFMGLQAKNIYIYSNDPEMPIRRFPVTYFSDPRYRFLWDEKNPVLQVTENGRAAIAYLTYPENRPFKVTGTRLSVGYGSSTWRIWEGEKADPIFSEPVMKRKGYQINMLFSSNIGDGRRPVMLEVLTDDPKFPVMRMPFFLQKGIIVDPAVMYIANAKAGSTTSGIVSRPGQPFKILRFETKSKAISVKFEDIGKTDEYRIVVAYKGGLPSGDWNEDFEVITDDPTQPRVSGRVYVVVP
jgi:hypothetical protein